MLTFSVWPPYLIWDSPKLFLNCPCKNYHSWSILLNVDLIRGFHVGTRKCIIPPSHEMSTDALIFPVEINGLVELIGLIAFPLILESMEKKCYSRWRTPTKTLSTDEDVVFLRSKILSRHFIFYPVESYPVDLPILYNCCGTLRLYRHLFLAAGPISHVRI